MDVLTYDAEVGTQIDITIEDSTITATECFPLGRHSRYTAVTSVRGAWEKLTFSKLDQPDATVANDAISAILISYAPGQSISGTFYIDNLVAVAATSAPTRTPSTVAPSPPGAILFDEFATPNPFDTDVWQPRLPLSRSAATTGVYNPQAFDEYGATLLYPANRPATEWGPRYSTQIKSTEMNRYGKYETRLKSGRANAGEGVISAFFIYFNDEVDYDGDGIHDNHEIDFELLNSDRSSIWCSVYTDYQYVNDVCTFHRNSARISIATGEIWATVPGKEGSWDLVQIDSLDWSVPGFDHSASFHTYGFDWTENKVAFWIDLEDGSGRRHLFEVLSDGSGGPNDHIPNMPASTYFNLWHTYVDWFSRADAPPMSVDTVMEIDYVSVMPVSTSNEPTSHPATLAPVPGPSNPPSSPTPEPIDAVTPSPTKNPTAAPTSAPTSSPVVPSKTLFCGRGDGYVPCAEGRTKTAPVNEEHEVRCCRDCTGINCSRQWKRKCSSFDPNLYARSKVGGVCKVGTFAEAQQICENASNDDSSRLCTPKEIENNCAKDTGCQFNKELVWVCGNDGYACATDAECCGSCVNGTCGGESFSIFS